MSNLDGLVLLSNGYKCRSYIVAEVVSNEIDVKRAFFGRCFKLAFVRCNLKLLFRSREKALERWAVLPYMGTQRVKRTMQIVEAPASHSTTSTFDVTFIA